MKKIYVDTNIYLDFLLDRKNHGKPAYGLFRRAMNCEFSILVSHKILEELYGNIELSKTKMLITMLKPKLTVIKVSEEEIEQARQYGNHYQDILHAMLAQKHRAGYIVTRNLRHFKTSSVEAVLPEDI